MSKETIKIKGEITAKFWKQNNPLLRRWNRVIEFLMRVIPRKRSWFFRNFYYSGKMIAEDKRNNIICNAGLSRVAGGLADDLVLSHINMMILGTGSGVLNANRTTLFNEFYRNGTASGTHQNNICNLTAFFTQTEVVGTFTEFGNVIAGTTTANTGHLWSHIAGLNWMKDNLVTLTVDCKYTFQSV